MVRCDLASVVLLGGLLDYFLYFVFILVLIFFNSVLNVFVVLHKKFEQLLTFSLILGLSFKVLDRFISDALIIKLKGSLLLRHICISLLLQLALILLKL